jgi:hypothetical protein
MATRNLPASCACDVTEAGEVETSARREESMDIAQIVLLVGAANLVVLITGAVLAVARSLGRRRHGPRSGDGQTQHSPTDSGAAVS